jgi:hypothetical protein
MNYSYTEMPWYKAYCDAMLDSRDENLLTMINSALEAIRDRVLQLNPDHSSCSDEARQLQDALHYLTLLLEHAIHGGKVLLC